MKMIRKDKIDELFRPENTIIMTGAKGSGKTNTACVWMEQLVAHGYAIYTNIPFFDFDRIQEAKDRDKLTKYIDYQAKHQNIHVISGLYELLKGLVKKGKKVTILDEAGIHASSSQPMAKLTVAIKNLAYIIRHFDSSLMLITQTEKSISPTLRNDLADWKIKTERYQRYMSIGKRALSTDEYGNEFIDFPIEWEINNVPHSTFPYDSVFPTGFIMDIDLKEVLDALSKLPSSLEVEDEGEAIINELFKGTEPDLKDEIKKALKENPDWTDQEIADEVGCSQPYVNKVKNDK